MILVVSDKKFYIESLAHVLKSQGYKDIFYPPPLFKEILSRCNDSATVIIDMHTNGYSSNYGLSIVRKLRCDRKLKFKGKVIILSFEPLEQLKKTSDGEVLETKGIELLTIPFNISKLKELIGSASQVLQEEEWEIVSRPLRARIIVEIASDIRHKYDGTFCLSLSALNELKKLASYKGLDLVKRVRGELDSIQRMLTKQKLDNFYKELQSLLNEIEASNYCDEAYNSEGLRKGFDYVQRYLDSLNLLSDNFVEKLPEIMENSKKVKETIKYTLDFVTGMKEKIVKEKED